eukprot:2248466-Prymnesium_polylepis.1
MPSAQASRSTSSGSSSAFMPPIHTCTVSAQSMMPCALSIAIGTNSPTSDAQMSTLYESLFEKHATRRPQCKVAVDHQTYEHREHHRHDRHQCIVPAARHALLGPQQRIVLLLGRRRARRCRRRYNVPSQPRAALSREHRPKIATAHKQREAEDQHVDRLSHRDFETFEESSTPRAEVRTARCWKALRSVRTTVFVRVSEAAASRRSALAASPGRRRRPSAQGRWWRTTRRAGRARSRSTRRWARSCGENGAHRASPTATRDGHLRGEIAARRTKRRVPTWHR